MSKNDSQTPDTSGRDTANSNDVKVVGQTVPTVEDTVVGLPRESDEASSAIESFKLTKLKEEDAQPNGLVELEVVAEGAFQTEAGDVLRTGDRKLVSRKDAQVMLDAKVNGKSAFKEV